MIEQGNTAMDLTNVIDNSSKTVNYSFSAGTSGMQRNVQVAYIHSDSFNSVRFSRGDEGEYALVINNGGQMVKIAGRLDDVSIISGSDKPIYYSKKLLADKSLKDLLEGVNYAVKPADNNSLIEEALSQSRQVLQDLRLGSASVLQTVPQFDEKAVLLAAMKMWIAGYKRYRETNDTHSTEETEKLFARNGLFNCQFLHKKGNNPSPQLSSLANLVQDLQTEKVEELLKKPSEGTPLDSISDLDNSSSEIVEEYVRVKSDLYMRDFNTLREEFIRTIFEDVEPTSKIIEQIYHPVTNYMLIGDGSLDLARLSMIDNGDVEKTMATLDEKHKAVLKTLVTLRGYDRDFESAGELLDLFYKESGINPQEGNVMVIRVNNKDHQGTYLDTCAFYSNDELFDAAEQAILKQKLTDSDSDLTIEQLDRMIIDAYYVHPGSRETADIILTLFKDMAEDDLYDVREQILEARLDSLYLKDQKVIHRKLYEFMRAVFEVSVATEVRGDEALDGFIEALKSANREGLNSENFVLLLRNYAKCPRSDEIEKVLIAEAADLSQRVNSIGSGESMTPIEGILYSEKLEEMVKVKTMYEQILTAVHKFEEAKPIDRTFSRSLVPDRQTFDRIHMVKHYFESVQEGLFAELFVTPLIEEENVPEATKQAATAIYAAYQVIGAGTATLEEAYIDMEKSLKHLVTTEIDQDVHITTEKDSF